MKQQQKSQLAWAFYDWANSAFAVIVMTVFFPLFFKQYWAASLAPTESTFWLGVVSSTGSLLIMLLAPVFGAMADQLGRRKHFLLVLALLGIFMTFAMSLVGAGQWQLAIGFYLLAATGFTGANVFYDSLLLSVSGRGGRESDRVSALGFALGYLGGGLLFAFCVLLTQRPHWFQLSDFESAVKVSFVLVGLWWAVFTLPLVLYVREPVQPLRSAAAAMKSAAARVLLTLRELKQLRQAAIFLVAYWIYIDGVDTMIRMALDYGISIGFEATDLVIAILITQFIGFPATFVYGRVTRFVSVRSGILFGLSVYILVTIWGSLMQSVEEFYLLAAVVGLVQGGVQALSRSLYSRLIPPKQAAELYGFYNMVGKSAAVIGPVMMGWVAVVTGSHRIAILSILALFVIGFLMLLRVRVPPED